MATLRGWFNTFSKETPKEFLASYVDGTSMTVPGQGSDLAVIIQSIVKLPPLDERTFDSPANTEVDADTLIVRKEVEGLYPATGANLAEDISARKKAEKAAKEKEKTKEKPADPPPPTDPE